jgi:electron transfer flavoprotein beta subunit
VRVAAVVEQTWDPASIEVDPVSCLIDWSRAAPEPSPGSPEAVELALRLGEAHVFGLGPPPVEDLLRSCLALGAAAAATAPDVHSLAVALGSAAFDLVLAPHRSGDDGPSAVAGLLAGLLDLPQATAVESLEIAGDEAVVVRRLDRGEREELAVPLPAVIAVEPGIAMPRVASPVALLAARDARVAAIPPVPGRSSAVLLGHRPPRPAPPRMRTPDGALPAEARIAEVVGTAAGGPQRELVTGTAELVAERIARLLDERGFL